MRFQPSLTGRLNLSRTTPFFLGGGKALLSALYATAARIGIDVLYDTEVQDVGLDDGFVRSLAVFSHGFPLEVRAKAVIASSGGFQANIEWLKQGWGRAADNFLIRGTPCATGRVLRSLLDQGVAPVGDPTHCHAVAIASQPRWRRSTAGTPRPLRAAGGQAAGRGCRAAVPADDRRQTSLLLRATGVALAVHLGFVLALFVTLPYSKFVHAVYRTGALIRHAIERPDVRPASPIAEMVKVK